MSHEARCNSTAGSPCAPTPSQLRLYQTFIFATPILFSFILLFLFCLLYLRRRRNAVAVRAQFFTRGLFAAPLDHGLNKSFRDNIPVVVFDATLAEAGVDTQCAVCLGDYQLNEKLQKLPTCGHTFHLDCIDEWLAGNSTCPICRSSLLPTGRIVPVSSSPSHTTGTSSASEQQLQQQSQEEEAPGLEIHHLSTASRENQPVEVESHVIRID